jgi:hypothetical protein
MAGRVLSELAGQRDDPHEPTPHEPTRQKISAAE